MHNIFAHQECNREYKQTLDEYMKKYTQGSRKVKKGIVGFNEDSEKIFSVKDIVLSAVNDSVPSCVLDRYD